jgi:hypothetical protein
VGELESEISSSLTQLSSNNATASSSSSSSSNQPSDASKKETVPIHKQVLATIDPSAPDSARINALIKALESSHSAQQQAGLYHLFFIHLF